MSEIKITDLVPKETIEELVNLDDKIKGLIVTYTDTAKELAKGLTIEVKVIGDLDKLSELAAAKTKELSNAQQKLAEALDRRAAAQRETTNVAARNLMEQNRLDKATRESYTETIKFKEMMEKVNGTYQNRVKRLVEVNDALEKTKKKQKEYKEALRAGSLTQDEYEKKMIALTARSRELSQEKSSLTKLMRMEEKEAATVEDTYKNLSQRLEIMRDAYKSLIPEEKASDMGRELAAAIEDLNAHLIDEAANMGEFQRNVGNYAIAAQNGVVTTDSLSLVLGKQAVTLQDVADQTKILEEAKRMLDTSDEHYGETLEAINKQIEENKKRLTDVDDILGKEAKTVAEAEAQNKRLTEALKHIDLSADDAQERLEELRAQIRRNNQMIQQATCDHEKYAEKLLSMIGININLGNSFESLGQRGNFIAGLNTKFKAFGQTLTGLLANPYVLALLGIAGVVAGFKAWYDYNKGLIEASRLTQNFTGLTGEAADKVTANMSAISKTMGTDYQQTMESANVLVQHFGVSWDEAAQLIQDGYAAGADMSGEMMQNIEKFGPALRDAGLSADEFIAVLANTRNGIFTEDGMQAIQKAGNRLKSMTANTCKSLDAVGISSDKLKKDLEEGNISMIDAIQMVTDKLKELPENSQEAGNLMKNVFGRTAAEGGELLLQSISDINDNLEEQKEQMGELGRINEEQMSAQRELEETLAAVFKASGTSFEEMIGTAKTFIIKGITAMIKGLVSIVNWFGNLYQSSQGFRIAVNHIAAAFKNTWEICKFIFKQICDSFKAAGTLLEGVFTLDWDKINKGFKDGIKALGANVKTLGVNIMHNGSEAMTSAMNYKSDGKPLWDVDFDSFTGDGGGGGGKLPPDKDPDDKDPDDKGGGGGKGRKSKEIANRSKKDREQALREELQAIQELEEAKLKLMEEGLAKEVAQIRLNYKKKLEGIKKGSKNEAELRETLAEQCERDIAAVEDKYYTEMAKINLQNRLAVIEEGGEEATAIKLQQLAYSHKAELEEAKRNGADVALIEAKYAKMRKDIQEEHAAHLMDGLQKQYANEQKVLDNRQLNVMMTLEEEHAKKVKAAKGNAEKLEELEKEHQRKVAEWRRKYAEEEAQNAIDHLEEMLKIDNLSADERLNLEHELMKAQIELRNLVAENDIAMTQAETDNFKEQMEKRKEMINQWLSVAADACNNITELVSAVYDGKIQKVEEEQEALDEESQNEIDKITQLVNQKIISEEEGEARKRAIEEQSAKRNEEFEKKKAKLKYKQALWDKANSIAQAGIATALAITEALPNVVLAAIAGAMGALQIATILATPIPKYAKGTEHHKGGPAIVGDGGQSEVVMFGSTAFLTPDTPTLVDLPTGAVVLPSINDFNIEKTLLPVPPDMNPQVIVNNNYRSLERRIDNVASMIKRQTRQQHRDAYLREYERFKISKM